MQMGTTPTHQRPGFATAEEAIRASYADGDPVFYDRGTGANIRVHAPKLYILRSDDGFYWDRMREAM